MCTTIVVGKNRSATGSVLVAHSEELGRNALKVVQENRGAVDRTVDMILTSLRGEDLYIRTESAGPHPGKSP